MLSCEEAARRLAAEETEDASWPTRLATRLHLLVCRECRTYKDQLKVIGRVARDVSPEESTADEDALLRLNSKIAESIGNDGNDDSTP